MATHVAVRSLGELLITAGVVVMLFVAYQLVWTNFEARQNQDRVAEAIRSGWETPPAAGADSVGEGREERVGKPAPGQGFAILKIPRLGQDYAVPVLQGVGLDVLARGVGHYPRTAMPGQIGNFAVAGHRATNGEPFAHLDRLRRGDAITVETRLARFIYGVTSIKIVRPTDTWVIDPVPGKTGVRPRERLITMTTCNPRWGSTERLVVSGRLDRATPTGRGGAGSDRAGLDGPRLGTLAL